MPDSDSLLPSANDLHQRLTRNQRERYVLRTLLRLVLDAERQERDCSTLPEPRPEAASREGGQ
jgi:hypothetical protein